MRPEITVCVATHRRPEGLARLLASLAVQDAGVPFETIVVDGASTCADDEVCTAGVCTFECDETIENCEDPGRPRPPVW